MVRWYKEIYHEMIGVYIEESFKISGYIRPHGAGQWVGLLYGSIAFTGCLYQCDYTPTWLFSHT